MRLLMVPVQMLAKFDVNGNPEPVIFTYNNKDITVNRVIARRDETLPRSNRMIAFDCQSEIGGDLRRYEIKYEIDSCKWYLYKM